MMIGNVDYEFYRVGNRPGPSAYPVFGHGSFLRKRLSWRAARFLSDNEHKQDTITSPY